jgi:hypothetical protein
MGARYAAGKQAWGECQRCGLRALLSELVFDGHIPWIRVHKDCYESKHPQERSIDVSDPVSLFRPAPEQISIETPPVLSGSFDTPDVSLEWTAAEVSWSIIIEYRVYRTLAGADEELLDTLSVVRDDFGEITDEPLTLTDEAPAAGVYTYRVEGIESRGIAATSNSIDITVT